MGIRGIALTLRSFGALATGHSPDDHAVAVGLRHGWVSGSESSEFVCGLFAAAFNPNQADMDNDGERVVTAGWRCHSATTVLPYPCRFDT